MATKQSTEIKELKVFISDRFLEIKQDIKDARDDIKGLSNKVIDIEKQIAVIETKVDSTEKRFNTVEGKLPDISEKFGELKNWRQIAFIIIAAVVGWFVRGAKF